MKKLFFLTILISSLLILPLVNSVFANSDHNHESEIEEGRALVESKVSCDELSDEQLETIGEYLMEQMHPGESHEAMHKMMGMEKGTEYHKQFHVNMAKRMYCGENGMMNMMPMMQMLAPYGTEGSRSGMGNMMAQMMNFSSWGAWGWLGFFFMILFWILIVVGIIALIKWLINQISGEKKTKSPLDILKERYAKGEIDKKEFEEKKKDLV